MLAKELTRKGVAVHTEDSSPADCDETFREEQVHLTQVFDTLERLAKGTAERMERNAQEAAADKLSMADELTVNLATYADAMETYADFAAMNRIIAGYDRAGDADAKRLEDLAILLRQPYFAKIVLQFKPDTPPREIYIAAVGMVDEDYKRIVVDWRSPVAEVYYNQVMGQTSYEADGRSIEVDLKLRRQFDIQGAKLKSYFDSTVAIQDPLLLESLSQHRSAALQAITTTIQREQNQVIRHEDTPVLLVRGVAGSGKTSVMMQRIAYLFYRNRETLDPSNVVLITPNTVFQEYISEVLPEMGERNPQTLPWMTFMERLLPEGRGIGKANVDPNRLREIDAALGQLRFEQHDFRDLSYAGERLVSATQIDKLSKKHKNIAAGPHRITLIREDLRAKVEQRLAQIAADEKLFDELENMSPDEQLALLGAPLAALEEEELRVALRRLVRQRFAPALDALESDEWVDVDRIGRRVLKRDGLTSLEWLYLKMGITGMSAPEVRYVMIDEVQDYTEAQLMIAVRYFRRAHFLLLGDPNQAITEGTASFSAIRRIFSEGCGCVAECELSTSYRATAQITDLFASYAEPGTYLQISSVREDGEKPKRIECTSSEEYARELRHAVEEAAARPGLAALVIPWPSTAKGMRELLEDTCPPLLEGDDLLPTSGIVMVPLELAKGLEFDSVVIPDVSKESFPDEPLSRRRLYTTISRATQYLTMLVRNYSE